jgi:hypothetical protein
MKYLVLTLILLAACKGEYKDIEQRTAERVHEVATIVALERAKLNGSGSAYYQVCEKDECERRPIILHVECHTEWIRDYNPCQVFYWDGTMEILLCTENGCQKKPGL